MGACTSCDASSVGPASTAKLILADGGLKEFDRPVRSSAVNPAPARWFVCDADVMEFDGFVSAVGPDELLRPGQIYFLLPIAMLKNPLHAEDLAALAVKASAALMKNSPCGKSSVAPLVFPESRGEDDVAVVPTVGDRRRRRRTRTMSGDKLIKFASDLSAIPE